LPIHSGSPDESDILVRTAARNPHVRHVLRLGFDQQFSALITEVVQSWDAAMITDKIEVELGADLQYIRLTGSIVGGVAGVALPAVLVVAHFG
jgi:uncharacterized membrane-anchored protein YjiN (DUF445 family)